ncbi:MAG: MarR family transcriptional regulator [Frankiales bacterium]|nr:MarR family transcriptional regulator [Frankiales bacterium]
MSTDAGEEEIAALERELSLMLRRARAFSDALARAVHPDLEAAAYGLLAHIVDNEPDDVGVRAADLADHFGIDKSTVSRQVRLLESLGLLQRVADPSDARVLRLKATPEGELRLRGARRARRERLLQRIDHWDRAEVAELARLLGRYNQSAPTDVPRIA